MKKYPDWLNSGEWLDIAACTKVTEIDSAVNGNIQGIRQFAALISPAAMPCLESMAQRARCLTQSHFGRTISLYAPLYVSSYCSSGCLYCGFASDRQSKRHKLTKDELLKEIHSLKELGFDEILILTGEKTEEAGFDYLLECIEEAAKHFHKVTIESFSMSTEEYKKLVEAGCTGVCLYQETYDPVLYDKLHRWGQKKDYLFRLEAPSRALEAGIRTIGIGALLGLGNPVFEAISMYLHASYLCKRYWKAGVSISFPRIRPQEGGYKPDYTVTEKQLAQIIFALRICLPEIDLVMSTRESAEFRDGIAGVGISKMSIASRTTVGGYSSQPADTTSQFDVNDSRDIHEFCDSLRKKKLEPVLKNWDAIYR